MLKTLHIKNYAIIDDLTIEFNQGFNVFTGETGAGKSIIVGALSYLLKGRVDSSIIKADKDKAIIEGVFSLDHEEIKATLKEQDIDYEDELIVKRVIARDGHSSIKINESTVTLNFLADLLSNYVDIHSQKDSQYLFHKSNQLKTLDNYCANENLIKQYRDAYKKYKDLLKEYDELKNNTYNEREMEFFRYDLNELQEAKLDADEEKHLEELEIKLKASDKYINVLNTAIALYKKDGGIKEKFYELINSLNIDDKAINEEKEALNDLYYNLNERVENLVNILNSFNNEDLDIDKIEERLYQYSKLKRKHKTDVLGLVTLQAQLEDKIKTFEQRDIVLSEKEKALNLAYEQAKDLATKIHDLRLSKAHELETLVETEAKELLLNNCLFSIKFNQSELSINGIDDIEFFVSMNKGEEPKALKNVASGGEVSRLMLALKTVFSKLANTDLIILDEIDTGVSGKVSLAMGEKIAKIAKNTQVICITHLAPVAACANAHYYIYKEDNLFESQTKVKALNQEEIFHELASISNTNANEKALEAAKELYYNAQELVK